MLLVVALALPVGAGGALAAWVLTRLIGLITNTVFHHRVSTALVSPGESAAWWIVLLAPVVGASQAARVLTSHFGEQAGRKITRQMVEKWRENNL